jgi:hypothetical protein
MESSHLMPFTRIEHSGNAIPTTLAADITSGATSLALALSTGWPTGSVGPFYLTVNAGGATEEKILAGTRSGVTLSSLTRGADGTSAAAHSAGEPVVHGWTATEADEANQVAVDTIGSIVAKGDTWFGTGSKAIVRFAAGVNGTFIKYDSSQPSGVVASLVDENGLAASVAGNGIAGGAGTSLSVNVDNSTLAITTDQVHVATGGIAKANMAASVLAFPVQAAVTGGPTVGTTQLTLATLNIPSQFNGYEMECSAYWTGINDTSGDEFLFAINVDGVTKASGAMRHEAGGSERLLYSLPTSTLTLIAPSTTSIVTVTVQRSIGSGTINTDHAGVVTARLWF